VSDKPSYIPELISCAIYFAILMIGIKYSPDNADYWSGAYFAWVTMSFWQKYLERRYWNISVSEYWHKREQLSESKREAKRRFKESVQ
jgi:hypothetical protein